MSVLAVIVGYLLGSIPFGLLLTRSAGLGDIRKIGSGSIGATNVLRTGNRKAALLTLAGDGVKGYLAVFLAQWAAAQYALPAWLPAAAAVAVFLGHLYPVFFQFRGGKGVSTAAGIMFALEWPVGLVLMVVWLTLAFGFRISSLAALIAAVLMPVGLYYRTGPSAATGACVVIAVLLFWRHRANIRALLAGTERPIGR